VEILPHFVRHPCPHTHIDLVTVFRITSFPPVPAAESGYPRCRFVLRPAAVKNIVMSNRESCHADGVLLSRKKASFSEEMFLLAAGPCGPVSANRVKRDKLGGGGDKSTKLPDAATLAETIFARRKASGG
jgi:hypothetical protein